MWVGVLVEPGAQEEVQEEQEEQEATEGGEEEDGGGGGEVEPQGAGHHPGEGFQLGPSVGEEEEHGEEGEEEEGAEDVDAEEGPRVSLCPKSTERKRD